MSIRTSGIVHRGAVLAAAVAAGLAASLLTAAPAGAAPFPGAGGYVWGYQPTAASYVIPESAGSTFYGANDGDGPTTVTRSGTGRYSIRWGGLGTAAPAGGGVAHASAYGSTSDLCAVVSWGRGTDVVVSVACYDRSGAPKDTYFTANWTAVAGELTDGHYSYLWADQPATASYPPASHYRYDARGVAPWVFRDGVGDYRAYLPSTYTYPEQVTTFYQTTAYGAAAVSCKVTGYLGGGVVRVRCRDTAGALVDTRFSLTFTPANLLMRIAPTSLSHVTLTGTTPDFAWNNDSNLIHLRTVTRLGTGSYRIFYPQIASPYGHAVARATGTTDSRCQVSSWSFSGDDENIHVRCVNSAGTVVDSPFTIAFTW
nr:hypothetical protein [Micromonospora sp. DSM 115978]